MEMKKKLWRMIKSYSGESTIDYWYDILECNI